MANNGALGVVAVGASAGGVEAQLSRRLVTRAGSGMVARRYIELADEAEHAMTALGDRLPKGHSGSGERGG
jgi:two-component system chemotaxis response regulator CheB